ncbi:MAG TPA: histidine kinase dimerization/phospho-acceptor domain-containing protein, partial [Ktedonobacterales bacterium]|nr:histidine kinase dimerization/phospho-acceptor domain-containing protein [Ktedonobacterales bacterium]
MLSQHSLSQRIAAGYNGLRERFTSGRRTAADAPSAAMYRRIRLWLTLLYAAVLALVLLVAGGLLYYAMWQTVMGPVYDGLTTSANFYASNWQRSGLSPCLTHDRAESVVPGASFVACYGSTGTTFLGSIGPIDIAPGFLNVSLSRNAAENGSVSDIVDSGNVGGYHLGAISRYATVVRDPNTNQVLGIIQVGGGVGQLDAMHALLTLLLVLGPLELLGATIGGFFLAERALAPARLAFERQQTFIADASHELRTPLTLLRADAEVLLRGRARFDPDDAALLEDIVVETEHLSAIANNLLTLARLDSGAMRLEPDVVDLATIATDAAHRVDALARERGITVRLGQLSSVAVLGDPQLLAQATLALVDNALKYAGSGSEITLSTSREGDLATLAVHDTGPGIAAEHLPLLGQRFYRPDKARARAAGGAGLG